MKKIISFALVALILSACGGGSKNPDVRLGGSNYGYSNGQIQADTKVKEKAPLNRLHVSGVGKSHGAQRIFRINEKDYDIVVHGMTNPNVAHIRKRTTACSLPGKPCRTCNIAAPA